jgi:protein TonB
MPQTSRFAQCLVEGDAGRVALERKRRRRALGLSLLAQAALLCMPLFSPLFAAQERLVVFTLTPIPSYRGTSNADKPPGPGKPAPAKNSHPLLKSDTFFQPPEIPARIDTSEDGAPPEDAGEVGRGWDVPGDPNGLITGIGDRGQRGFPVMPPQPAEPVVPARPLSVSEGVQQGKLVHRVEPPYPTIAKQIRLEGTVVLRALIGRDGTVRSVQIVSGPPILAAAAREAIAQWRYQPTRLNGETVEVETLITVIFTLNR